MFWKKHILWLLIPMMILSLGHIHYASHDDHQEGMCTHQTHEPHCETCKTDIPEKTQPPRDTAAPQLNQLLLLVTFISYDVATRLHSDRPHQSFIHLEYRDKQFAMQRLRSVLFLT